MEETIVRTRHAPAALAALAGSVVVLFGLEFLAVSRPAGQRLDESAMRTLSAGAGTLAHLHSYLGNITVGTTALGLVVCVVLAVLRKRYRLAVGAVAIIAGANVTTQILKHVVFDRPDYGMLSVNSYPSGHTTAAISCVLAAVLVAPVWLRHLVVVLGSFAATLVGASTIVGAWHRPSDIVGALAVSLAWAAAASLVVGETHRPGADRRWADGFGHTSLLALGGAAVAGALLIVLGVRPDDGIAGLIDAALILGATGVATALTISAYARLVPR